MKHFRNSRRLSATIESTLKEQPKPLTMTYKRVWDAISSALGGVRRKKSDTIKKTRLSKFQRKNLFSSFRTSDINNLLASCRFQ